VPRPQLGFRWNSPHDVDGAEQAPPEDPEGPVLYGIVDEHLAELLLVAVQGRGAFRRFKDVLAERTGTLEPYFVFAEERKLRRAAK
jgi:hypothetical protein